MKNLEQTSEYGVLPTPTSKKTRALSALGKFAEGLAWHFVTYALPDNFLQEAHSHLEVAMTHIATLWAGLGS